MWVSIKNRRDVFGAQGLEILAVFGFDSVE